MSRYKNYTKEQLIQKIKQLESKKYGLVWDDEKEPEKVVLECQNNIPILKKVDEKTIKTDIEKTTNILIEGDNYHALQVLNYTHKGQIDVIYIDPPYNTGKNDFTYNDKFVDKEDGYRHSKWLNFMSKRLKLAHNLLKDSGVIFISIDDNEVAQLKLLCDEVFKDNFLGFLSVINNLKGRSDDKFFATSNEYLLVYAKNKNISCINGFQIEDSELDKYTEVDEKSIFKMIDLRKTGKGWQREHRPFMFYPILYKNNQIFLPQENEIKSLYNKENKQFNDDYLEVLKKDYESKGYLFIVPQDTNGVYGRWRWQFSTLIKNIKLNNVICRKTSEWKIFEKMRPSIDDIQRTIKPKTIFYKSEYDTGSATTYLKNMFDNKELFDNPKSLYFIQDLIYIATQSNSIILDFFAGSGTTGHAVLELNKEDGGNRQFILCTNNENNICEEVTYPRISKVINGYTTPKGIDVSGLGGNLDYYKTDLIPTNGISNITDSTREELTKRAGDMIAIKENTYYMVELCEHYQIFINEATNKQTAIYFTEDLSHFDELIEKTKSHFTKLYIFSFGKIDKSSYKYLGKNYQIEDIPEPIIEIYKEINKEGVL